MEKIDAQIVALLPKSLKKKLEASAKRNGRTTSGEVRFILSKALARGAAK